MHWNVFFFFLEAIARDGPPANVVIKHGGFERGGAEASALAARERAGAGLQFVDPPQTFGEPRVLRVLSYERSN